MVLDKLIVVLPNLSKREKMTADIIRLGPMIENVWGMAGKQLHDPVDYSLKVFNMSRALILHKGDKGYYVSARNGKDNDDYPDHTVITWDELMELVCGKKDSRMVQFHGQEINS